MAEPDATDLMDAFGNATGPRSDLSSGVGNAQCLDVHLENTYVIDLPGNRRIGDLRPASHARRRCESSRKENQGESEAGNDSDSSP